MVNSVKHSLQTLMLLLLMVVCAGAQPAQQTVQKPGTGSVTGQVKIAETAAPGIAIALISISADARSPQAQTTARATTGADGSYQIGNLSAGRYRAIVMAPGYVVSSNASTVQL